MNIFILLAIIPYALIIDKPEDKDNEEAIKQYKTVKSILVVAQLTFLIVGILKAWSDGLL